MPRGMTDEQQEAYFLRDGVDSRIRRLRVLIDQIEIKARQALDSAEQGNSQYASVPEVFIKELAWGLANAHVEGLVYTAARADIYRAEASASDSKED